MDDYYNHISDKQAKLYIISIAGVIVSIVLGIILYPLFAVTSLDGALGFSDFLFYIFLRIITSLIYIIAQILMINNCRDIKKHDKCWKIHKRNKANVFKNVFDMVIIFYNRLCKNLQHYLVIKLLGELMNNKFKKISIFLFILTVICFICGFGFLLSAAITAPLFTLDSGAINLFEFLSDYGLKFILISVPYYAFALLFIHSQKRLSESEKASSRFYIISEKINKLLLVIYTLIMILILIYIYSIS